MECENLPLKASEGQFWEFFGWMCMKCEVQNCKMWVMSNFFTKTRYVNFSAFDLWIFFPLSQVNLWQKGDVCIKFHIVLHVASQLKGLTCLVTTLRLTRMDCCQVESEMWGFCSKVYEMRIGLTENIRMREKAHNANSNASTVLDQVPTPFYSYPEFGFHWGPQCYVSLSSPFHW